MREGNEGSSFYVLLQGSARVTCQSSDLDAVLTAGAPFGEGALLHAMRREGTVTALEDCYLLQFDGAQVRGLPGIDLDELNASMVAALLERMPFFSALSRRPRLTLGTLLRVRYYPTGATIFTEGDAPDAMYLLTEGRVSLARATSGEVVGYVEQAERPCERRPPCPDTRSRL